MAIACRSYTSTSYKQTSCYGLLLLPAATAYCYGLLLLPAATAYCYRLLLLPAATAPIIMRGNLLSHRALKKWEWVGIIMRATLLSPGALRKWGWKRNLLLPIAACWPIVTACCVLDNE